MFENLLGKTMPQGRASLDTASHSAVYHMPHDALEEIVFEGRDLRDALRIHTKELTRELRREVEQTHFGGNRSRLSIRRRDQKCKSSTPNHERRYAFSQWIPFRGAAPIFSRSFAT